MWFDERRTAADWRRARAHLCKGDPATGRAVRRVYSIVNESILARAGFLLARAAGVRLTLTPFHLTSKETNDAESKAAGDGRRRAGRRVLHRDVRALAGQAGRQGQGRRRQRWRRASGHGRGED